MECNCLRKQVHYVSYNPYSPRWEVFSHGADGVHANYEVGIHAPNGVNYCTVLYLMRGCSESEIG